MSCACEIPVYYCTDCRARDALVAERDRLRQALRDITEMPLEGDLDYEPGLSERAAAERALEGGA